MLVTKTKLLAVAGCTKLFPVRSRWQKSYWAIRLRSCIYHLKAV